MGFALAAIGAGAARDRAGLLYWVYPDPLRRRRSVLTGIGTTSRRGLIMATPVTRRLRNRRACTRGDTHGAVRWRRRRPFDNTAMWLTDGRRPDGRRPRRGAVAIGRCIAGRRRDSAAVWVLSSARMQRARTGLAAGWFRRHRAAIGDRPTRTRTRLRRRVERNDQAGASADAAPSGAKRWPMIKDFWLTGVGAGAYERAMMVYQQSPRVSATSITRTTSIFRLPRRAASCSRCRRSSSPSPARWRIRRSLQRGPDAASTGCGREPSAGSIAVAVQSLWETGLRVPANASLFALLAAIAMYEQKP